MTMRRTIALLLCAATPAWAGDEAQQVSLRDPWVPPAVSQAASAAPETRGAALQAQVERKLRASFEKADVSGSGRITREQARAAGLGFVAEHFDRIDAGRTGRVSFDDLKRYLDEQRSR